MSKAWTEYNQQIAYAAVNKWMYYAWNFSSHSFVINGQGITAPSCFKAFDGHYLQKHFIDKFISMDSSLGGTQRLLKMWFEFGTEHKKELINWITTNYKGDE